MRRQIFSFLDSKKDMFELSWVRMDWPEFHVLSHVSSKSECENSVGQIKRKHKVGKAGRRREDKREKPVFRRLLLFDRRKEELLKRQNERNKEHR